MHVKSKFILAGIAIFCMTANARNSNRRSHSWPKLSDQQCANLRQDLQVYTHRLSSIEDRLPFLSSILNAAMTRASQRVNRLCPLPPTLYECTVMNQDFTFAVSLGADSTGKLVNVNSPNKTVCMTDNGCKVIAAQAFPVFGDSQTSRCSDSSDTTVVHLSDAQMQAQVNALNGN